MIYPYEECMEKLSDAIRAGEPVSFEDALDVIDYQMRVRRYENENRWWRRWLRIIGFTA